MAADAKENPIKLTISLLVSNRKDTIRKCMESLKPLLDAVPSELIAVDTVGEENSDGSLAIVREYTEQIIRFEWCNDFAAARNAGLMAAKGEWFLFLDDDEWFEDVSEMISFFASGEDKSYNSGTYRIRNYKDLEGREYSEAVLGRVVRRTEELRFVGKVHERFSEFSLPCKEISSYVHHYGYVYRTEEERLAHIRRNQELLKQELMNNPENLHLRTQMALELATYDNEAALAFCEETFRICAGEHEKAEFQWQMSLVFRLYEALGIGLEKAEATYEQLKGRYGFSETAENAIAYQMTRICLLEEKNAQAYPYTQVFFATLHFLVTHPKEAQLQMAADFARYRAENVIREMQQFAAFAKEQAEEKKRMECEKKVLLTVSLLVSNRKDTIRKCMESLKPLLAAVPSELIAVDTVGEENSDGSLAIVREYTNQIIHFDWCNDFAAARNAGLMAARGEWFLFIDDDEWFEDTMPIQMFFLEGDYKKYDRAWYYVRNYRDYSGNSYVDTVADRMCKITPQTRFVGRVHESIAPQGTQVMQFFCYAHHYGYVFKNQEEREKHTERNCSLLEIELEEHPEDPRIMGQLLQEYMVSKQYGELTEKASEWLEKNKEKIENPFSQYIAVTWLKATIEKDALEEAEALADKLEKYRFDEIPRAAYLVQCIRVKMLRQKHEEVLERAEEYFKLFTLIQKEKNRYLDQQVFDLKNYVSAQRVENIMEYAVSAALKCHKNDMAKRYLQNVCWDDENNKPFGIMTQLAIAYGETGNGDMFFPYMERMMENPQMRKPLMVAIEGIVRDHPERRADISVWLQMWNDKEKRKKANAEMQKLAEQLKENIKVLIAAGNFEEAKQLLVALKEIVPEDEDIEELEGML